MSAGARSFKDTCARFDSFFVAIDESTGLKDTEQLAVLMRRVMPSLVIVEKVVQLIPIEGTITGEDIFKALLTVMADVKLLLLYCGWPPVMIGQKKRRRFPPGKTDKRHWNFPQN